MSYRDDFDIDKLNKISPSFCLAKWLQVTIDLCNGTTHSCHHPTRHQIPIDELEKNPSALHNTNFKKQQRKLMLEGQRPRECAYCWKIEDTPGEHVSDRLIKSFDFWARPQLEAISQLNWNQDVNPSYLEIMFSNKCNFRCSYCMADISSSIADEIQKHGLYNVKDPYHRSHRQRKRDIPTPNPFIKAFWEWFPLLVKDLKVLRITGGEPLLDENTFKIFAHLNDHPAPDLILALNTNLGISPKKINQTLKIISALEEGKCIKQFELYVSIDTWGEQAEYIRSGLNYKEFWRLVYSAIELNSNFIITFMSTFSLLSIPNYKKLLEDILELKQHHRHVLLDISYLRHPNYLSANLIPVDFHPQVQACVEFMKSNHSNNTSGFTNYEINKLERIYNWLQITENELILKENRIDFYSFIKEYDRRNNLNFIKTFPILEKFYKDCGAI